MAKVKVCLRKTGSRIATDRKNSILYSRVPFRGHNGRQELQIVHYKLNFIKTALFMLISSNNPFSCFRNITVQNLDFTRQAADST